MTEQAWQSPLALVLAETAEMVVRHPVSGEPMPDREGQPQVIRVAGIDSPQFRRVLAERQAALRAAAQEPDADALRLELAVGCTVAWHLLGPDGGQLPCTPETVRDVYQRCGWLLQQVDRHMVDREAYLGEC
jgi:hypothetical protein